MSDKPRRRLLIMACPRSGTRFTSKYISALGVPFPHEEIGPYGGIGWQYAVAKPYSPKHGSRDDFEFENIVYQVRHPLSVIVSMTTHSPAMRRWVSRELGGIPTDGLAWGMNFYWRWMREMERYSDVWYRVEDLWPHDRAELLLRTYLREMTMETRAALPFASDNARPHKRILWDDLQRVDKILAHNIYKLSRKYGYCQGAACGPTISTSNHG